MPVHSRTCSFSDRISVSRLPHLSAPSLDTAAQSSPCASFHNLRPSWATWSNSKHVLLGLGIVQGVPAKPGLLMNAALGTVDSRAGECTCGHCAAHEAQGCARRPWHFGPCMALHSGILPSWNSRRRAKTTLAPSIAATRPAVMHSEPERLKRPNGLLGSVRARAQGCQSFALEGAARPEGQSVQRLSG